LLPLRKLPAVSAAPECVVSQCRGSGGVGNRPVCSAPRLSVKRAGRAGVGAKEIDPLRLTLGKRDVVRLTVAFFCRRNRWVRCPRRSSGSRVAACSPCSKEPPKAIVNGPSVGAGHPKRCQFRIGMVFQMGLNRRGRKRRRVLPAEVAALALDRWSAWRGRCRENGIRRGRPTPCWR